MRAPDEGALPSLRRRCFNEYRNEMWREQMYICVFVYGSLGNGWMDSDKSCGWFIRLFVVSSVLMMRFELGFSFDYFFFYRIN